MPESSTTLTHPLTRREFLKGTAYASALSVGGVSGLASASSSLAQQAQTGVSEIAAEAGLLAVAVTNRSDSLVALNPQQPVSLEKVNGWIVVKINKVAQAEPAEVVMGQQISLAPGQQCSFPVDAALATALTAGSTDIVITNEYSTLNNLVPLMHADTMAA